jgi:P27 family predicted phage terminase small subunit
MGRPNKPTADHVARGNPGKRGRNRQEPDPDYLDDASCATAPAWLPKPAQAVWIEYAPKMRKAKVLTVIDVEPFARWCVLVARYKVVVADLERLGVMIDRSDRGGEKAVTADAEKSKTAAPFVINQLVFVESMLLKQLLAVEREFGMTPAARTRVQIEPQLTLFPEDAADAKAKSKSGPAPKAKPAYFTGGDTAH